jgi:hypothetical protein
MLCEQDVQPYLYRLKTSCSYNINMIKNVLCMSNWHSTMSILLGIFMHIFNVDSQGIYLVIPAMVEHN